jgi:hypothetical protein
VVAITLEELPGVLKALRDKAAETAPATVMAIADTYQQHLTHVTLRRSFAAPGQFGTPAAPGQPPAWRTGALARSVTSVLGASSGLTARATVAPHTVYSRVQNQGAVNRPTHARYMHWVNSGGSWYKKVVRIPPRPFMEPALRDCIDNGSLVKSAMEAFYVQVWG